MLNEVLLVIGLNWVLANENHFEPIKKGGKILQDITTEFWQLLICWALLTLGSRPSSIYNRQKVLKEFEGRWCINCWVTDIVSLHFQTNNLSLAKDTPHLEVKRRYQPRRGDFEQLQEFSLKQLYNQWRMPNSVIKGFGTCENGLLKMIPIIPHNLYVCFKLEFLSLWNVDFG